MPSIERIRLPVKLALILSGPTLYTAIFLFKGVLARLLFESDHSLDGDAFCLLDDKKTFMV